MKITPATKLALEVNKLEDKQYKEVCQPLHTCSYMQYGDNPTYTFHVGPVFGECDIDTNDIAKTLIKTGKAKNVLDLGSGHGKVVECLRKDFGLNAIGVIPEGSLKNRPDYLIHGNVQRLKEIPELKSMKFSCIISAFTVMHLINPKKTIEDAYALLEDNGLLILDTTSFPGLTWDQYELLANELLKKGYDIITGYPGPGLHGLRSQCFMIRKTASHPELKLPIEMDRMETCCNDPKLYYRPNMELQMRPPLSSEEATNMHIGNICRLEKWGIEVPEKVLRAAKAYEQRIQSEKMLPTGIQRIHHRHVDSHNPVTIRRTLGLRLDLGREKTSKGHLGLFHGMAPSFHLLSSIPSDRKPFAKKAKHVMVGIPGELQQIIKTGGFLYNFLDKNLISLDQLTQFYHHTPWVLDALRSDNFIAAINLNLLTIEQIGGLTESQTKSLQWREKGAALKLNVEKFLILNQQKLPLFQQRVKLYGDQPNVNSLFANAQLSKDIHDEMLKRNRHKSARDQEAYDRQFGLTVTR